MSDFSINSSAPRYLQVHDLIKNDIFEQKLKQGERLPSEEELAKKYHVSRMTLRKSLSLLINEGYIYSQHGVGTFISQLPMRVDYTKMISFSAWVRAQGHEPDAQILSVFEVPFDREIYDGLNIKKEGSVVCINRLRKIDGLPVAIEFSYHPKKNYENFHVVDPQTELKSIYTVLERSGYHAAREVDIISATTANREQAVLLDISKGDALITFKTITFSKEGIPIELLKMVTRPDRFQFTLVLPR
jgi:GntR family transcriptional regulator